MATVHNLVLICPHCSGRMYEEETYFEQGEKKIELGCYQCPKKMYVNYRKYMNFLEKKVAKR